MVDAGILPHVRGPEVRVNIEGVGVVAVLDVDEEKEGEGERGG